MTARKKQSFCSISILGIALGMALPARAQVVQLTFNTLPSAQGWTYTAAGGGTESSYFSVDGTTLHQNTMGTGLGAGGSHFQYYVLNGVVPLTKPFVLEVRARVLNSERSDSGGFAFGAFTGSEIFEIFMDKTTIQDATQTTISTTTDTTVFHDYRLEGTPGLQYNFFVDGVLTATGAPRLASTADQLAIGDLTSGGNAQADVTFYQFTVDPAPALQPGIVPTHGGNAGPATVTITGSGFQPGATVKLTGSGADIVGTSTAVSNASVLATTFDLAGALPGARALVVTNPDNSSSSLPLAFTVDQGGAPQLWVNVLGRSTIRFGGAQPFYVSYGNRGNVDASGVHLIVTFPSSLISSLGFANEVGVVTTGIVGANAVVTIDVGSLPTGSTLSLPIILTSGSQPPFSIQASIHGQ